MEFSFYLPCYWPDMTYPAERVYADMLAQAKYAEDLGFATLSVPEHHFVNLLIHPNPLMTAIKVASVTERIRISTSVLVLPFYNIRRLAGEIAQADHLTDGRIDIGVGRGAFRYEFDRMGVPIEESRERFDDSLELLKALLTDTEVSWDSKYYNFPPLTITPRPLQRPHPPIWLAAVTKEAIYHSVLRGYNIMTTPLRDPFAGAKQQADAFLKGVADAGAGAAHLRLSMLRMAYVARDEADAREKVAMAYGNDQRHQNLRTTAGDVRQGAITPLPTGRTLDEVADALLIGTPEQCIEKIRPYVDLGIHDFMLNMSFGASHREVMASMERFVTKVLPHVKPVTDAEGLRHAGEA